MLDTWEWIIIGIVGVVIIMWGPNKIPEFARTIGRARAEFEKASKEFNAVATEAMKTPTETASTVPRARSKDEILIETAQTLGISIDGKTRKEISEEIAKKIKNLNA